MFSSGIQRVKVNMRKDAIPKYFLNNSDDEKFKEPIFIKSGKLQNYSKKCCEFNVYFEVLQILLTQLTPKFHFYISLKPEETRFFLRFLRGCKNGKLVWNELIKGKLIFLSHIFFTEAATGGVL